MSEEFDVLNEIEGLSDLMGIPKRRGNSSRETHTESWSNQRDARPQVARQRSTSSRAGALRDSYENARDSRPVSRDTGRTSRNLYEDDAPRPRPRSASRNEPRSGGMRRPAAVDWESVETLTHAVGQLARLQERNAGDLQMQVSGLTEHMSDLVSSMTTHIEVALRRLESAAQSLEEATHIQSNLGRRRPTYREPPAFSEEDDAFLEEAIATSPPLRDGSGAMSMASVQRESSDDT